MAESVDVALAMAFGGAVLVVAVVRAALVVFAKRLLAADGVVGLLLAHLRLDVWALGLVIAATSLRFRVEELVVGCLACFLVGAVLHAVAAASLGLLVGLPIGGLRQDVTATVGRTGLAHVVDAVVGRVRTGVRQRGLQNENRIGTILLQSDTEDTDAADETT